MCIRDSHDYSDIPDLAHLSMYVENVVLYIAGFVVKRVLAKISCVQCMSAVTVDTLDDAASSLLTRKNRGGLMLPAPDVVLVCKVCERVFRTWFHSNAGKLPAGDKVKARLINDVLRFVLDVEVFSCLDDHVLENDILNEHRKRLVKLVCNQYLAVRLFHAGKVLTRQMQGDRVRSVLSKTIILRGSRCSFLVAGSSNYPPSTPHPRVMSDVGLGWSYWGILSQLLRSQCVCSFL